MFAKHACEKSYRGFESPSLRKQNAAKAATGENPNQVYLNEDFEEVSMIRSISILFHLPQKGDHEIIPLSPQQNGCVAQLDRAAAF